LSQQRFRELHDILLDYKGNSAYADVLLPWLSESKEIQQWLHAFSQREGRPIPPASVEDLWSLYAVSRVFDLLILRFQESDADSGWAGPNITSHELIAFIEALGLTVTQPTEFSTFYHEVVKVDQNEDEATRIVAYKWPCVMLGHMLILRAGVEVRASANTLMPGIADRSTLYWAYRRKGRPYQDLSHGWGHNSQWRTSFRRDYAIGESTYFNVDGKCDLAANGLDCPDEEDSNDGLTLAERIELLTNRCFVTCAKPHGDLWPYDDRLTVCP